LKKLFLLPLLLLTAMTIRAQDVPEPLQTFLRQEMHLSTANFAALKQRNVITKLPKTTDSREVAAFSIVRVNAPGAVLTEKLLDIENFKRGEAVLQIGKFSEAPSLVDVQRLTLEKDDLEALRKCRVGSCDLKLSAAMIERFRKEVNWLAADWREQATALFRQLLVDYVKAYLREGNKALAEYHDKSDVLRLADETNALLREAPYLKDHAREFLSYLEQYPSGQLPDVKNFIYWSKEKFGLKPTVSLTQVTIYRRRQEVFVASKQLYANHYFEASIGLTVLAEAERSTAFWLMYLNRSRIDALRGGWSGLKRSIAGRRIRKGLEANLRLTQERLEAAARRPSRLNRSQGREFCFKLLRHLCGSLIVCKIDRRSDSDRHLAGPREIAV
jgi:hypothetical protein